MNRCATSLLYEDMYDFLIIMNTCMVFLLHEHKYDLLYTSVVGVPNVNSQSFEL